MRRRSALHLLAAASLSLAGCTAFPDGNGEERPTPSTDDAGVPPAETPTPAGGSGGPHELGETVHVEGAGAVTVESATVQRSIIDHHTWRELREPGDGQVLVLRVDGRVDADSPTTFAPRFDGRMVDDAEFERDVTPDTRRFAVEYP
jgi:hypothetical protein